MEVILKEDIARQLRKVGLERGDTVMVHTSLRRMGYVCGGAQTVIEALIEVVGDTGTILMPTQSWKTWTRRKGFTGKRTRRIGRKSGTTGRPMTST